MFQHRPTDDWFNRIMSWFARDSLATFNGLCPTGQCVQDKHSSNEVSRWEVLCPHPMANRHTNLGEDCF
jgi:hypothetical protein